MGAYTSGIVFLLVFVPGLVLCERNQQAILYDGPGCTGQHIVLKEHKEVNLETAGFGGKRIKSVSVTGVWIFYENTYFNRVNQGLSKVVFSEQNRCEDISNFLNTVNSARFAGNPKDYQIDCFNLYEKDHFQGAETCIRSDTDNIPLSETNSVIITGDDPWTFYTQPGCTGLGICLQPQNIHKPYFCANFCVQFPVICHNQESIKCAKKGCYSTDQTTNVTLPSFEDI